MNHQTKTNTPETATLASMQRTHQEWQAHGERLERERDDAKFDADDESRWAMSYKTQRDAAHRTLREEQRLHVQTLNERDELREALSACMEDSIELLSERGYAQRYAQTAVNIIEAQALLAATQK